MSARFTGNAMRAQKSAHQAVVQLSSAVAPKLPRTGPHTRKNDGLNTGALDARRESKPPARAARIVRNPPDARKATERMAPLRSDQRRPIPCQRSFLGPSKRWRQTLSPRTVDAILIPRVDEAGTGHASGGESRTRPTLTLQIRLPTRANGERKAQPHLVRTLPPRSPSRPWRHG